MGNNTTWRMSKANEPKNEPKIKNLCEDGNFHEHDEKSYEIMKQHQEHKDNK